MAGISKMTLKSSELPSFRVRLRREGLKEFSLTFIDEESAVMWVRENEEKFFQNPAKYIMWLALLKKRARDEQCYEKVLGKWQLVIDNILCGRGHGHD